MIRPQPPRLRMKRRKTVSVTPAIGARTVAGVITTLPISNVGAGVLARAAAARNCGSEERDARAATPASTPAGLSQNFRMAVVILQARCKPKGLHRGGLPV